MVRPPLCLPAGGTDWSGVATSTNMFSYCRELEGGNGTAWSGSNVTAVMARVDGLDGQAGYFTAK